MSKKNENSQFALPDKSYLLQNAKMFHQQINSRKCRLLIAKCLIYINNQGKNSYYDLTPDEQTQLFFGASKLFHCKEYQLRQIVYILMMELTKAKDTIIMTNLLTKDIAATFEELFGKPLNTISLGKEEGPKDQSLIHTSNALKTLSKMIDPSLLQAFERFYTTCIVDKQPIVSSAAICSAYMLYPHNKEVVKKWSNLIQDQVNGYDFTSYHALSTLYLLKQSDPIAILKLCLSFSTSLNSPWALSMLITIIKQALIQDFTTAKLTSPPFDQLFQFLNKNLSSRYDMVILSACQAISQLAILSQSTSPLSTQMVQPCITQLSVLLSSSKLPSKFASLNLLNKLSLYYPTLISNYNIDLEHLITDTNTSIATFAITILLKTGNEASVDRLMNQIKLFASDLNEEFKMIIVDAIRQLSLKFPSKYPTLLQFLSMVLREEGNFNYKSCILDAIIVMINTIPNCQSNALAVLCEFIEDCEYSTLSVRVLHVLSQIGPLMDNASQYIKTIYNRIILESSNVRSAALHALSCFNSPIVKELLSTCHTDPDNQVRERSLYYSSSLVKKQQQVFDVDDLVNELTQNGLKNLKTVKLVNKADAKVIKPVQLQQHSPVMQPEAPIVAIAPLEKLKEIPQFQPLLPHYWCSSTPLKLSEDEFEYPVSCILHMFTNDAIVIETHIKNTLEDVYISKALLSISTTALKLKIELPCQIEPMQEGTSWMGYMKQPGLILDDIKCQLKLIVHDMDINEKGYEEVHEMESLMMGIGHYIKPTHTSIKSQHTVVETYQLTVCKTLEQCCQLLLKEFHMGVIDHTDIVQNKLNHVLKMGGELMGGLPVEIVVRMVVELDIGVNVELTVKSDSKEICQLIADSL